MKCSECGEPVADDAKVCPHCGKNLTAPPNKQLDSIKFYCYACNDELEFVSAYKQWYCYTCQKYVKDPKPAAPTEPKPAAEEEPIIGSPPEIDWNGDVDADAKDSNSIKITNTAITEESLKEEPDSGKSDEDESETELSWDDAIESDDSRSIDDKTEPMEEPVSTEDIIISGPIAGIDLVTDEITNLSIEDVELEIDPESMSADMAELSSERVQLKDDTELKKKALAKLHQAWLKVNNLKAKYPGDDQILHLESKLKNLIGGARDPQDSIILADESIDEAVKLEKKLQEVIHREISDLFHFVNSKIHLAKKIGFNIENLEEELDNISSLIAMSEYHKARRDLEALLQKIFELPKAQDEIMIGLEEQSDIIQELLAPLPNKDT
jgi:hypothetical protein